MQAGSYYSTIKSVYSKQEGGCFLVYSATVLIQTQSVLKASGKLPFGLFSYCTNTGNLCSKQGGDCFLVNSATVLK